jgi:tryptophanase
MGFKTFNSVINEDYDEMLGKDKITQVIKSAEELASIYDTPKVLDICRFNQELYFNFQHRKKIYNEFFLNKICDVKNLTIPKTLI